MIQVWLYDENKVFIESTFVDEVIENMTTVPLLVGYYKPTFDETTHDWYEGATQEEIDKIIADEEANRPQQEPSLEHKITLCLEQIAALEEENMILSEYVLGLEMKSLEQEEAVTMTNEYVLDIDMRLTNIETK